MKHSAIFALACLASLITAVAADNVKAFPAPEKGMSRFVVTLHPEQNEADLKVEIVIGKTVLLEPSNRYFFATGR
jgi:ecotin